MAAVTSPDTALWPQANDRSNTVIALGEADHSKIAPITA